MAGRFRNRFTFSNVVSVISLIFALGLGSAWAATELDKNEVKSKHIKNRGVKTKDLANNAITSPKVADGSLLDQDFAAGQLPAGPQGEQGPQGPAGPAGATNLRTRAGTPQTCTGEGCQAFAEALCNAGERAVGGGGLAYIPDDLGASLPLGGETSDPRGWWVSGTDDQNDGDSELLVRAFVVCASP